MRSDVTESLNGDLSRICTFCNLWGMRLNPNKTQGKIVSRSTTVFPPHPNLLVGSTSIKACDSFKIPGIMFDSKFPFGRHIRSISSSFAQKIGLLRTSFKNLWGSRYLIEMLRFFDPSLFGVLLPVWSSAADSYLQLFDKNLQACKFFIPNLTITLQHRRFINSPCMLYKTFHNPLHFLQSKFPNLFHPIRVTRGCLSIDSLSL